MLRKLGIAAGVVLVGVLAVFFGYRQLVRRDFDKICDAFSEIGQRGPATPEQNFAMAKYFEDHILTPPARNTLSMMQYAAPESKYEILVRGSRESGYATWECPAMRNFFERLR